MARFARRRNACFFALALAATAPAAAENGSIGKPDPASGQPAASPVFSFNIRPQSLATALNTYSAITGIPLLYNSRLAAGRSSPGIKGTFGAPEALKALLEGSGLAPIEATHHSLSLVLRSQDVQFAANSPINAPVLPLNTLRVVPPSLGDHLFYATAVRYAIQDALQRDHTVYEIKYRVDINVWVSPTGMIEQFQFLAPTGHTDIDNAIARTVHGVVINEPPPSDLPQPVHVNILANGGR